MRSKLFIAVAGNIGTGKTTLTKMLSEHYGWRPYFEAVADNPYLEDFYADMKRWSFPLQVFFLNHRFRVHNEITSGNATSIQDRSIYEDNHIFARNLYDSGQMSKRDYENYTALYEQMISYLPPPDLLLYLRKSTDRLMEQIAQRGRSFEANIEKSYINDLNRYYDEWVGSYDRGRVLVIDTDDMDFVKFPTHFDLISRKVLAEIDQKELFLPSV